MTILRVLGLSVLMFAATNAQAFSAPFYIQFNAQTAAVQIANPYAYPIVCQGTLQALRSDGFVQYENFVLGPIPYGAAPYAYTFTGAPFWFMNAGAYFDCGVI